MKNWNVLWASLLRQSAQLSWKAVLVALFAVVALTAAGCTDYRINSNPSGGNGSRG
jgi:4-hydroxybenzoate polyprenyltransferase